MTTALPGGSARGPWGFPRSLADLHGPTNETVTLPLHLCWSGQRSFDVTQPSARLRLYQILITEGDRGDIEGFLNAHHLLAVWPMLRRLLHPRYVRPWEERFPELLQVAEAAEPALEEALARARQAARDGSSL